MSSSSIERSEDNSHVFTKTQWKEKWRSPVSKPLLRRKKIGDILPNSNPNLFPLTTSLYLDHRPIGSTLPKKKATPKEILNGTVAAFSLRRPSSWNERASAITSTTRPASFHVNVKERRTSRTLWNAKDQKTQDTADKAPLPRSLSRPSSARSLSNINRTWKLKKKKDIVAVKFAVPPPDRVRKQPTRDPVAQQKTTEDAKKIPARRRSLLGKRANKNKNKGKKKGSKKKGAAKKSHKLSSLDSESDCDDEGWSPGLLEPWDYGDELEDSTNTQAYIFEMWGNNAPVFEDLEELDALDDDDVDILDGGKERGGPATWTESSPPFHSPRYSSQSHSSNSAPAASPRSSRKPSSHSAATHERYAFSDPATTTKDTNQSAASSPRALFHPTRKQMSTQRKKKRRSAKGRRKSCGQRSPTNSHSLRMRRRPKNTVTSKYHVA